MLAVIKTGGKQYKIGVGEKIKVESLGLEVGAKVEFDKVLMVSENDQVVLGQPTIENVSVSGTVSKVGRHRKVTIIKFRRRKHSALKKGHRQYFSEVVIDAINTSGAQAKSTAKVASSTAKKADTETAPKKATSKVADKLVAKAATDAKPKQAVAAKKDDAPSAE